MRLRSVPQRVGIVLLDSDNRPLQRETEWLKLNRKLSVENISKVAVIRPVFQVKYWGERIEGKMVAARFSIFKNDNEVHSIHWVLPFRYYLTFSPRPDLCLRWDGLERKDYLAADWRLDVDLALLESRELMPLRVAERLPFLRRQNYVETASFDWTIVQVRTTNSAGLLAVPRGDIDYDRDVAVNLDEL